MNALDRIPKLMEQYKTQNAAIEKDLPTLREIVGGTWKKEEELKGLKSEVATLERKIQLELAPSGTEQKEDYKPKQGQKNSVYSSSDEENNQFAKEHIIIAGVKPPAREIGKGIKF